MALSLSKNRLERAVTFKDRMRIYMISVCLSTYLLLFLIFLFLLNRGIHLRLRKRHYSGRWRFEHISFAMAWSMHHSQVSQTWTEKSFHILVATQNSRPHYSKFSQPSRICSFYIYSVWFLLPACEEIFVQSVATGYSAAKNISPASKRRSLRLHDATSTGQQIRLICGSQCGNQKRDWGNSTSLPFHQHMSKMPEAIEASFRAKSKVELRMTARHCPCTWNAFQVPTMFHWCSKKKISGRGHSIFLVRAFQTTWPKEVKVQKDLGNKLKEIT